MSMAALKILVVEDNPELAQLIAQTMLRQGQAPPFTSICVGELKPCLDRLRGRDVDAVILDLNLPDSHGLQSLRAIRNQNPELPIIVLTAIEDESAALQALREGAQDYLLKSEISSNMLVRAIRFAMERKRGEQAHARLAAIVEGSRDAIISMDVDGAILSWNPAAERMFGYRFEEVAGRSMSMFFPADAPDEMAGILQWLPPGDPGEEFETVRQARAGRLVQLGASHLPGKGSG